MNSRPSTGFISLALIACLVICSASRSSLDVTKKLSDDSGAEKSYPSRSVPEGPRSHEEEDRFSKSLHQISSTKIGETTSAGQVTSPTSVRQKDGLQNSRPEVRVEEKGAKQDGENLGIDLKEVNPSYPGSLLLKHFSTNISSVNHWNETVAKLQNGSPFILFDKNQRLIGSMREGDNLKLTSSKTRILIKSSSFVTGLPSNESIISAQVTSHKIESASEGKNDSPAKPTSMNEKPSDDKNEKNRFQSRPNFPTPSANPETSHGENRLQRNNGPLMGQTRVTNNQNVDAKVFSGESTPSSLGTNASLEPTQLAPKDVKAATTIPSPSTTFPDSNSNETSYGLVSSTAKPQREDRKTHFFDDPTESRGKNVSLVPYSIIKAPTRAKAQPSPQPREPECPKGQRWASSRCRLVRN